MGSLNKVVREQTLYAGHVATDGALTLAVGLTNGASATGSNTLTDTSLNTITLPKTMPELGKILVTMATSGIAVATPSTTAPTIRTYNVDGTTKAAHAFDFIILGK